VSGFFPPSVSFAGARARAPRCNAYRLCSLRIKVASFAAIAETALFPSSPARENYPRRCNWLFFRDSAPSCLSLADSMTTLAISVIDPGMILVISVQRYPREVDGVIHVCARAASLLRYERDVNLRCANGRPYSSSERIQSISPQFTSL